MEKFNPVLCDFCDVKIGERFYIYYYERPQSYYCFDENGRLWGYKDGNKHKVGINTIYFILNHKEDIIHIDRISKEEMEILSMLKNVLDVSEIECKEEGSKIAIQRIYLHPFFIKSQYFNFLKPNQKLPLEWMKE